MAVGSGTSQCGCSHRLSFPHLDPRCLAMPLHCHKINTVCVCVHFYVRVCVYVCVCVRTGVYVSTCGEGRGGFWVFSFYCLFCFFILLFVFILYSTLGCILMYEKRFINKI